jgi:heme ABC exporter ATP-binding subunit CcmA/heme exporter protein CcmB
MAPTNRLTPSIGTNAVVCRFGAVRALDGASLAVDAGTVTALVGPNGAGKTTLLRVLATLHRPDGGNARIAGYDVVDDADRVRRLIGYVGHRSLLYMDLTALENLRFHGRLHGLDCTTEGLREALAGVGLDHRRHDRVRGFSRGTVQRLAIARAVLHEPPVLLLDEPHTGLDPVASETLDDALVALARSGRTVLLATHGLDRAAKLADNVSVIHRGRIAWSSGADGIGPAELEERYLDLTQAGTMRDGTGAARGRLETNTAGDGGRTARRATPGDAPVAVGRTGFAAATRAIVWKDLAVEVRAREIVPPVLVFALLVVVIFQFSLPPVIAVRQAAAAGAFWVALLLGSTLGISRAMAAETESGGMTGLLVSPIDRGALFAGKWLAGYGFAFLVGALLVPAFAVLLELRVSWAQLAGLVGVLALGLAGWSAAGVLLGGMAVNTRAREVLLPVLLYPLVLPLVIPAVQATAIVLSGAPLSEAVGPLALIAAYDIVFLVLGFLFLSHVVGE